MKRKGKQKKSEEMSKLDISNTSATFAKNLSASLERMLQRKESEISKEKRN